MSNSAGEMPFLDHLEELRKRILLALGGIMVGLGIGWWLTRHYQLIRVIEAPIKPYVPSGKLMVTSLVDPFMLNFKLAIVAGMVLASPWVIYQLWIFLAPALTPREKKALLPSLGVGLLLFLGGAAIGWIWVVPPTVKWFIQFDLGSFNTQITYDSYVSLVIHVLLAMGISAELPLVMVLLAALGVVPYRMYKKLRRYAFFLSFVGGAILSPTPEVVSMILFTIPLLLLYEVGVAGAYLIERHNLRVARRTIAAGVALLVLATPHRLHAQVPPAPPPAPGGQPDTGLRMVTGRGVRSIDSSTAKRLGIPAGPTRVFPSPDSVMQALLDREGFAATRFVADSATFDVIDQRILLGGRAATDRDASILEANQIVYDDARCEVLAQGEPRMFEPGQAALIGITMHFNTCNERGMIGEAYTSFNELGANWFIRGNLAVDSSAKRLYAAHTEFTTCDLPDPHYHFVAGQMKWVSQSVMVARPAVLYIRDVPVAWLPFIFQDTKNGRASGILIPRFGFNDIVRTDRNYNRQLTNLGYYWAPNDYIDATASLDWYANRNTTYRGQFEYRWLNRFVNGSITVGDLIQSDGATTKTISWQHNQSLNVTTSIAVNFNYASSGTVLQNNAIDPSLSTRGIYSQLSLQKRYKWGQVSIGGTRNQSLNDGSGTMTLPSVTVSPGAFAFGRHVTWSPSFSAHNDDAFGTPNTVLSISQTGVDTIQSTGHSRLSVITLNTPVDFFGLTWSNSVQYQDRQISGPITVAQRIPDPSKPAGTTDSINVTTVRAGDFDTRFDWTTSMALPSLFRNTWKVTPTMGVTNIAPGAPFLLRTPGSNGNWVSQGKTLAFGITSVPSFFGFINRGIGPYQRFRYEFAPALSLNWSPAASVSSAFAKALASAGGVSQLDFPAVMNASVALHQSFVGKVRIPAGDTNTDPIHLQNLPKKQIFAITTSSVGYDFEQAKLPGRTGWTTAALTNSFQSDLLQGFTLSMTHDLWQGQVGTDSARFSPFLSQVQANFSLTGHTFRTIAGFLGLAHRDTVTATGPALGTSSPLAAASALSLLRPGATQLQGLQNRGFNASVTYQLSRQRAIGPTAQPVTTDPIGIPGTTLDPTGSLTLLPVILPEPQSSLGLTMSFSPTPFWTVSWNTLYDISHGTFEQQQIQLQRDLHDWRASFNFVKNVNGNFALYFSVFLLNLPDIKFDYNQTTLQQTPLTP
jgi:Tat protein translocase TatC